MDHLLNRLSVETQEHQEAAPPCGDSGVQHRNCERVLQLRMYDGEVDDFEDEEPDIFIGDGL